MPFSTFSISGLASGLDTSAMINELMRVERLPVVRYEQRQAELRKVDDAWGTVNTKLSALRSAVDKLRDADAFDAFVTSASSNEDAAAVSVTGTPAAGSLSFTVTGLARAHQFAYAELDAADASLWSGAEETLSLTKGGETYELTTTSATTLQTLAAQINDLDAGMSAQVIQTSAGKYRMIVASEESGTANAVTVTGAPAALGAKTDLQVAADATLDLGGGVVVTRSSNTVTDLIDGATIQLRKVDANPVTITTSRDDEAVEKAVQNLVDSANGVLTKLKDLTSYDPESRTGGALQGDATARKLAMDLRARLSGLVDDVTGAYTSASGVGISLTRDGLVELDTAKLQEAIDADFSSVADLFARSGSTDNGAARFVSASDRTVAGSYGLEITRLATVASVTGATYTPPVDGLPKTLTVTAEDGTVVSVTISSPDDLSTAVSKINAGLAAAGVTTITAKAGQAADGTDALMLHETRYGAGVGFSVTGSGDWGLDGTYAGSDVAGTIGGNAAVGSGRTLTGSEGATDGLAVEIVGAATGSYGTVSLSHGLGGALDSVLRWAEGDKTSGDPNVATGAIERARNTLTAEIDRYDDQIAAFEVRLESREVTLRRKFASLETALANIQSQSQWIAGMLPAAPQ